MKANDHTCSYYCERPACVLAQRNELREMMLGQVFTELRDRGADKFTDNTHSFMERLSDGGVPLSFTLAPTAGGPLLEVTIVPERLKPPVAEVAGRIIIPAKSASGEPLTPWIGTIEPERLPPAPLCCCTDPPMKMLLTFYMESTVGPVQRVDAACPACGAVVKGLKL